MQSTMMNLPLTITSIMEFADKVYPNQEIVSVTLDNTNHRYCYKDAFKRTRQLANALESLGLKQGDVVATMAWNDYRHLELYYAISCSGMVCHTVNPRLFDDQIEYIINHAEDQWLFIDPLFVPKLEVMQEKLPNIKGFVVLTCEQNMPETSLRNVRCYEALIASHDDKINWPALDENTASALCYTSGTTGNPKGVVYSHRSTVLHSYASNMSGAFGMKHEDVMMPIVPMFHVNGWGVVYSAPMSGTKLVMPGPKMADGEMLTRLINNEKITLSAGVPTIWQALLDYLESSGQTIKSIKRLGVGGAACPLSIFKAFKEKYDVDVEHGWGMTETSPMGTFNIMDAADFDLPEEAFNQKILRQGRPIFGIDLRIVDEERNELPWDGKSFGDVQVRGSWVTQSYHKLEGEFTQDGWFDTGDVAYLDKESRMQITDRSKDIIKSGGEWISTIELENQAVNHPDIAEAAVIGVYHDKWTERPLLLVVVKSGKSISSDEMLAWFKGKVATWWIPSACEFVEELPHTATGKLDKKVMKAQYKGYEWPEFA